MAELQSANECGKKRKLEQRRHTEGISKPVSGVETVSSVCPVSLRLAIRIKGKVGKALSSLT